MSMYDGNSAKESLYDEIMRFLEDHSVYELLQIVTDCVEGRG